MPIKVVILVKWAKISGDRVTGTAEVWRRGPTGNLVLKEIVCLFLIRTRRAKADTSVQPIFPAAVPAVDQRINLTKEVFGAALLPGRDPAIVLPLDISRLRVIASEVMLQKMNLTLA